MKKGGDAMGTADGRRSVTFLLMVLRSRPAGPGGRM